MFDVKIITLFPVYYWIVRDNIIPEWEKKYRIYSDFCFKKYIYMIYMSNSIGAS